MLQALYPQLGISAVFLVIGGTISWILWRHIQFLHEHYEKKMDARDAKIESLANANQQVITNNTLQSRDTQKAIENLSELVKQSLK